MDNFDEAYHGEEIAPESWRYITELFFQHIGIVDQQIISFNEFIENSMQQIIDLMPATKISPNGVNFDGITRPTIEYRIQFGQLHVTVPKYSEMNGEAINLKPNDARLRELTYATSLFVDIIETKIVDGEEQMVKNHEKVFIGKIPIMVKSKLCWLNDLNERDLYELNECPYDKGGYFIVNGTEKVIICQERMATNAIFVFPAKESKYSLKSEIRSTSGCGYSSMLSVNMLTRSSKPATGQTFVVSLPFIRDDIPVIIIFRALGFVNDADILKFIVYDFSDSEIAEMIKPSIDEAFAIQDEDVALNFIGTRRARPGVTFEKRVQYARDILNKEFLPHIGSTEDTKLKKAYFLGYMINRLIQTALGRRQTDDRDHYGNKRIDLAGPLMASLFRSLMKKLCHEMKIYLSKCLNDFPDKPLSLLSAIRPKTKPI